MVPNANTAKHFSLAVMIFVIGCVLDEPYKGPQTFNPEYLLREELSHTEPQKHEMVIIPEDLQNRPELKDVITRYMSIKQSDSDVAASIFVQDAIERNDGTLTPRDMADLQLIHATGLYGRAKFLEAESSCDRAIEFDSTNWRAFHFRAMLREKRGQIRNSVMICEVCPKSVESHYATFPRREV